MTTGSPPTLFAGLDGGASTSRVRVIDGEGRVIGEGAAGPASLTLGAELAATHARQALQQALDGSGFDLAACRLVCGLAGHRQAGRRAAFERLLGDVGAIEVIADGYAALLGAHGGAAGAIVILGTGSVGIGTDAAGRLRQVGGWGPVAGDEGGGNWIGRHAVRAMLRALDEAVDGRVPSPFLDAIRIALGGHHEAMLDWLADADATRFAALAPEVLHHAAAGDALAARLLDDAAIEAGRLIRLIGEDGRLPVALLGGLADALSPRLSPAIGALTVPTAADAMDGALLRARGLAPPEVYAS